MLQIALVNISNGPLESELWFFCVYLLLEADKQTSRQANKQTSRRLSDLSYLWSTSVGLELSLTDVCRTWAIFDWRLSDLSYFWPTSVGLEPSLAWRLSDLSNLDRGGSPPRPTAAKKDFILIFSIGIRIPQKRKEKIYRIKWIPPPPPPEKFSRKKPYQNIIRQSPKYVVSGPWAVLWVNRLGHENRWPQLSYREL